MSDDSRKIMLLAQELRKVCAQISALLSTADGLMGGKGWAPYSNLCLHHTSANINIPQRWIPYDVFRYYFNEDDPCKILFITVLLDDRGLSGEHQEQALITAGCFDYEDDEVGDNWEYHWRRWHDYMPANNNGEFFTVNPAKEWPDEVYPFKVVTTMGLPLAVIGNANDLSSKIIDPLLSFVKKS